MEADDNFESIVILCQYGYMWIQLPLYIFFIHTLLYMSLKYCFYLYVAKPMKKGINIIIINTYTYCY